jgi:hypothetical protein
MATATELTRAGITAARRGDKEQAAELLRQATEADPRYEMAWLWRSSVARSESEKRVYLERALIANPKSELAKLGLAQLGPPVESPPKLAAPAPTVPIPPPHAVQVVEATIDPHAPARMIAGPTGTGWQCSRCGRALHPQAQGCAFCKQTFAPGSIPPEARTARVVVQKPSSRAAFVVVTLLLVIVMLWFVSVLFSAGKQTVPSSAAPAVYGTIVGYTQVGFVKDIR